MDEIARHYDINDRITEIFEKCVNDGYKWGFGTLIVEKVISQAIKSGLVVYKQPEPYGTFDKRKAAQRRLDGHYMIVVHPMETGAEYSYALMIEANNFEEAEAIRQSTKSKDGYGTYNIPDYSWYQIVNHGIPTPDIILKNHAYLSIVWLSEKIKIAKAQAERNAAFEAKHNPEGKGIIAVTKAMVDDALQGIERLEP